MLDGLFFGGESDNSLSIRINAHQALTNNPDNFLVLVSIQSKSLQLPLILVGIYITTHIIEIMEQVIPYYSCGGIGNK